MRALARKFVAALALSLMVFAGTPIHAAEVSDGHTPANGKAMPGDPNYYWDGGSQRAQRGNSTGEPYTQDASKWDFQYQINLRANQPISAEFTSAIMDVRKMGRDPTLMISWAGGIEPLYIGLDYFYTGTLDSTTIFRPRLGKSDPRNVSGTDLGTFRTLRTGAVAIDSTLGAGGIRSSWALPLSVDSLGTSLGWAPYVRVHIWTDGSVVNGVYAHIVGRP